MNSRNNILSIYDIQIMSMTDIVYAYSNGYRLGTHKLDMSTWLVRVLVWVQIQIKRVLRINIL